MTLRDTDDAAKAVQKTPYRIALDYIESQIEDEVRLEVPPDLMHVTILLVTLQNGFVLVGKSIPADPVNYDADLGMKFAREDAIRQAWPLFAFQLRCEMTGSKLIVDE